MNDTEKKILSVSRKLFSEKTASQVTVREIAEKSGISHTTIYLYFKSKREIIEALALEPLAQLYEDLQQVFLSTDEPKQKLLTMSKRYISFGLEQKNSYLLVSVYEGERVDLESYQAPLSRSRMQSLDLFKQILAELLPQNLTDEQRLNIVRGVFFFLHGVIMTYMDCSPEEFKRIYGIVEDYLGYTILSPHY